MDVNTHRSFVVDRNSGASVKAQLQAHIEYRIAIGAYRPGEPLPSAEALAAELGVDNGTVRATYAALKSAGLVRAGRGTRTFISDAALSPRLLSSVARAVLSPEMSVARSLGCERAHIERVLHELVDEVFSSPARSRKVQ